jgi:hypothetical protein
MTTDELMVELCDAVEALERAADSCHGLYPGAAFRETSFQIEWAAKLVDDALDRLRELEGAAA